MDGQFPGVLAPGKPAAVHPVAPVRFSWIGLIRFLRPVLVCGRLQSLCVLR
jgi:hypothetical protein